jgi:hypothetical protein
VADFHTLSKLSRVIEKLASENEYGEKIVLQLITAKGSPTPFIHRTTVGSILYGLSCWCALLLLAFLPRRLNDVIDTQ